MARACSNTWRRRRESALASFVLCGHNKCGTRWLAEVLGSSPSLEFVSGRNIRKYLEDHERVLRDLAENSAKPLFIDYAYAIQDPSALELLKRIDAEMSGVLIYREPMDAMLSMHNYQRWTYRSGKLFGTARGLEVDGVIADTDFVESAKSGLLREQFERVYRYDLNAKRLRQYFPRYLELLYDDLKADGDAFVRKIFGFCRVEPVYRLPEQKVNPSMAVRSWFADKVISKGFLLLTGLNSAVLYDRFKSERLRPSLFRLLLRLNYKGPHFLNDDEQRDLRETFRAMVEEFAKVTELDLNAWQYD